MNKEDIDKLFSSENNEALEAHKDIVAIQKDKSHLLKFGQDWLDNSLAGGMNNKLLFFGSRPGSGKTYHCSQTINNLLNTEINPTPVKILRYNLEVPTSTLLVREIAKVTGRKISEIFKEVYTEEEKPKVTQVVNSFKDPRIINISKTLKGEDFRYMIKKFIEDVDKEDQELNRETKKIVLIDHIHIYPNKETIDNILLICNDLKLADKNLTFIFYFQLSRTVEDLWRDTKDKKINPRNLLPNSTFIYLTDVLQQVADLVVGMVIPQIYDLDEFAAINKDRNKHLENHFIENNPDNSYVRLKGRNRIYYNLIKQRMLDSFDDPKLFCELLDSKYEEVADKLMEENKKSTIPTFTKTNLEMPKFENPNAGITPIYNLSDAFDPPVATPF